MTQSNAAATTTVAAPVRTRVVVGSPIYNEIVQCLYEEASLLDEARFVDWAALLEKDLKYTAPLRITRTGRDQAKNIVRTTKHFDDDYSSIMDRLGRLKTTSAWAEDPPSRTRRSITNVRVYETSVPNEYEVISYLFLARSRYEESQYSFITAVRNDLWRRVDGIYKLARREIIIDQSVVGMQNLAIFL